MHILAIGFTGVPFFNNDVKAEAIARGHSMDFCSARALTTDVSSKGVEIRAGVHNLKKYDVIHMGAIKSNRWALVAAMGYAHKTYGCEVIDRRVIDAKLSHFSGLSKYFTEYENDINLPRSITFKRVDEIADRLHEFTMPVVVKTNNGSQGRGVGLMHNIKEIHAFVASHLERSSGTTFVLREFIPNDGDYRVNVIDGVAVTCLKRTPQKGEFRSNISLGGFLSNTDDSETGEIRAVAEKIAQLAHYDIAGVDVMVHKETNEPYILEVNRAPGSLEDDTEASGVDLAGIIVDLYESRMEAKRQAHDLAALQETKARRWFHIS